MKKSLLVIFILFSFAQLFAHNPDSLTLQELKKQLSSLKSWILPVEHISLDLKQEMTLISAEEVSSSSGQYAVSLQSGYVAFGKKHIIQEPDLLPISSDTNDSFFRYYYEIKKPLSQIDSLYEERRNIDRLKKQIEGSWAVWTSDTISTNLINLDEQDLWCFFNASGFKEESTELKRAGSWIFFDSKQLLVHIINHDNTHKDLVRYYTIISVDKNQVLLESKRLIYNTQPMYFILNKVN